MNTVDEASSSAGSYVCIRLYTYTTLYYSYAVYELYRVIEKDGRDLKPL